MANDQKTQPQEVQLYKARLPYHPRFEEQYGIDKGQWRTLVEATWPSARTVEAVQMALAYCQARKLDPFKRPVHIVPVWSSTLKTMVETVWPGISEIRTTASRTKNYGGMKPAEFGPTIKKTWKDKDGKDAEVEFPEWCRITVIRTLQGVPMDFPGPMVRWLETYAAEGGKEHSEAPNSMWRKRPWGQIEKCAEAAALRRAFPEEVGNDYSMEEMEGQIYHGGGVVIDAEQDTNQMPSDKGPPKSAPPVKGKQAQVEDKREIPMDTEIERERETVEQTRTDEGNQDHDPRDDETPQAEEVKDEERKPEPQKGKKTKPKDEPKKEIDESNPANIYGNLLGSLRAAMKQAEASGEEKPIGDWMKETLADRKLLPGEYQKKFQAIIGVVYSDPFAGEKALKDF